MRLPQQRRQIIYFFILNNVEKIVFFHIIFITMTHKNLTYISNGGIVLGISAEIGGTALFLSKNNSENILHSNPALWNPAERPTPEITGDFIPYNGHTVWLGPQSGWWKQQSANAERKQEQAVWPPDPFITYGTYTILHKTEHSISILSPESPVWGVQIQKDYAINPDGSIFLSVTLIATTQTVSWDIWFNTRVHGFHTAYVCAAPEDIRTEHVISEQSTEMPSHYTQGFFHYTACPPPPSHTERSSKTYIYPKTPHIYAFSSEHVLHITFEKHQKAEIHAEHALVELYNHTEQNPAQSLLELEYHSPYKTIHPGERIEAWQVWNIHDYSGAQNSEEHIHFINSQLL